VSEEETYARDRGAEEHKMCRAPAAGRRSEGTPRQASRSYQGHKQEGETYQPGVEERVHLQVRYPEAQSGVRRLGVGILVRARAPAENGALQPAIEGIDEHQLSNRQRRLVARCYQFAHPVVERRVLAPF